MVESVVEDIERSQSWVGEGRSTNHVPVFLQEKKNRYKTPWPFKFNSFWLKEPKLIDIVNEEWKRYNREGEESDIYQFNDDMKRVEGLTTYWAKKKYKGSLTQLNSIEEEISRVYNRDSSCIFLEDEKMTLKNLEDKEGIVVERIQAKTKE